jgi:hypothetical protein
MSFCAQEKSSFFLTPVTVRLPREYLPPPQARTGGLAKMTFSLGKCRILTPRFARPRQRSELPGFDALLHGHVTDKNGCDCAGKPRRQNPVVGIREKSTMKARAAGVENR